MSQLYQLRQDMYDISSLNNRLKLLITALYIYHIYCLTPLSSFNTTTKYTLCIPTTTTITTTTTTTTTTCVFICHAWLIVVLCHQNYIASPCIAASPFSYTVPSRQRMNIE